MLFDEGERRIDRRKVRCASHYAPLTLLPDETCRHEAAQMEGKRRGRHAKARLQLTDRKTIGAGPHEQAHDLKARDIAQFGESACGCFYFHAADMARSAADYN